MLRIKILGCHVIFAFIGCNFGYNLIISIMAYILGWRCGDHYELSPHKKHLSFRVCTNRTKRIIIMFECNSSEQEQRLKFRAYNTPNTKFRLVDSDPVFIPYKVINCLFTTAYNHMTNVF